MEQHFGNKPDKSKLDREFQNQAASAETTPEKITANLLAYLDLRLEVNLERGLAEWQRVFSKARENWEIQFSGQLLHRLKRYPLSPTQRATVLILEAHWLAQQAQWAKAAAVFERSLALSPENTAALSGLGNVLQHLEDRVGEAITYQQDALSRATPLDRASILNNLGLTYYKNGRLDQAETTLLEASEAYRATSDRINEASALHNLGSVAWTRGRLPEAQRYFESALALYRDLGLGYAEAETLNSLGLVQEAEGRWDEAADTYRRALALRQQAGDEYGQAQILANLGNVLTLSGNYAQAQVCFDSGRLIAQGLREAQLEGHLLTGLGELRLAQGRFEEATQALQQALGRKQAGGETRSLKHTWLSLGALYHQLRRPTEAEAAYELALSAARAQGDQRVETHTLINLAKLAMAQSQLDRAADYIEAVAPLAAESEFSDALADLAELQGDLEVLRPEPDYHQLLARYVEALAHARDFNPATLQRKMNYLVQVIRALADDGQPQTGAQMANDIAHLAERMSLPSTVSSTFQGLARDLQSSGNIISAL